MARWIALMGTARKLPMAKKKRRSALQKKQILSQQLKGWAVNSANARLAREGERKGIKYDVSRNVLVRRAVDAYKERETALEDLQSPTRH